MDIFSFHKDESGAAAVEYAIMIALILVAVIGAISVFGSNTDEVWGRLSKEFGEGINGAAAQPDGG